MPVTGIQFILWLQSTVLLGHCFVRKGHYYKFSQTFQNDCWNKQSVWKKWWLVTARTQGCYYQTKWVYAGEWAVHATSLGETSKLPPGLFQTAWAAMKEFSKLWHAHNSSGKLHDEGSLFGLQHSADMTSSQDGKQQVPWIVSQCSNATVQPLTCSRYSASSCLLHLAKTTLF